MATSLQKDAITNELKGVVFEFMVAQRLAKKLSLLPVFIKSLSSDHVKRLQQYESHLRMYMPLWYQSLPLLAEEAALSITPIFSDERLQGLSLAGKEHLHENSEGDLIISTENGIRPISLKLGKWNSSINTKSAGVRSFIQEYFHFEESAKIQEEFNQRVDLYFNQMAHDLHQSVGLDYPGNFELWVSEGHSELPGELAPEQHQLVKNYYHQISRDLYQLILKFFEVNRQKTIESLLPLLGFGQDRIVQAICFHEEGVFRQMHVTTSEQAILELKNIQLQSTPPEVGYFDLVAKGFVLQLRIKPMNKFSAKSVKINCSVKFKLL